MLAQQRYALILDLLNRNGIVYTSDLVSQLNVSSETVRKDLDYLGRAGHLTRVHGGAVSTPAAEVPPASRPEYPSLQLRNAQHIEEKNAITRYAATMVQEHQVIALDYGSTSYMMAQALKDSFDHLTIVTNSVQNALLLADAPNFTVILTGGILNNKEYTLVDTSYPLLDKLHIDIFFMSVSGIDPKVGCTDLGFSEANMQNWMRNASSKTIVLADSSNFGKSSMVKVCPIDAVDLIVTDIGLSSEMRERFSETSANLKMIPGQQEAVSK